jgi:uncharacterized membrane protein YtjA (UPF0391 family)
MIKWTAIFLVIALVAALFGFTDIASGAAEIAKIIFFTFITLVVITGILAITIFKKN